MNIKNNIPQEILELLPWFTTNQLSTKDQTVFENALNTYPALQEQVDDEREFVKVIKANKSILHKRVIASPEERLKAVCNTIDNPVVKHHKKCKIQSSNFASLFKTFKNTLHPVTSTHFATFAGIGALVISVAAITAVVIPSDTVKSDFTLASAADNPASSHAVADSVDIKLLVGFNGSTEELKSMAILQGKNIHIESPADKEGFFQISFKQTLNEVEIKETLDGLLANEDKVWFAGEAY